MNCQKKKFNLSKKVAYLNCAYMSPLLKKVEHAGIKGIKRKRKPYHLESDDFFREVDTVRLLYAELIHSPQPNRIVVVPSVSYGMAQVVNNTPLAKGDHIVVAAGQFPSNVYPWQSHCQRHEATLKIIPPPDTEDHRGQKWNEAILEAIDGRTQVVSLGQVHWADGTRFDLAAMRQRCDEKGAALVIDGTQSVGALPLDVQAIRPDALVVAGHKWLLGHYGNGLAYYGPRYDHGASIEQNWANRLLSEDFAHLDRYEGDYQEGAIRYEVGEKSHFIMNPMLIAAMKQVRAWGVEQIQDYCGALVRGPIAQIQELGFYVEDENARASHLFGIRIPSGKMEALTKALHHHGVHASIRGDFLRVSPHVYNDEKDMKRLTDVFVRLAGGD